jgi:hypothetical protein
VFAVFPPRIEYQGGDRNGDRAKYENDRDTDCYYFRVDLEHPFPPFPNLTSLSVMLTYVLAMYDRSAVVLFHPYARNRENLLFFCDFLHSAGIFETKRALPLSHCHGGA